MVFLLLIVVILITERSLVDGMIFAGHKTKETTDHLAERTRIRARERAEKREEVRQEREARLARQREMAAENKAKEELESQSKKVYPSGSNLVLFPSKDGSGNAQVALEGDFPEEGAKGGKMNTARQETAGRAGNGNRHKSGGADRLLKASEESLELSRENIRTSVKSNPNDWPSDLRKNQQVEGQPVLYHDGAVDIPLIRNDAYLARKQALEGYDPESYKAREKYEDPYDKAMFGEKKETRHKIVVKPSPASIDLPEDPVSVEAANQREHFTFEEPESGYVMPEPQTGFLAQSEEISAEAASDEIKPQPEPVYYAEEAYEEQNEVIEAPAEDYQWASEAGADELAGRTMAQDPVPDAKPAVSVSFDASAVSTEKVFDKEEFPDGYVDSNETAEKAGLGQAGGSGSAKQKPVGPTGEYHFPPITLLNENKEEAASYSREELLESARHLEEVLAVYGVEAKVVQVNRGPAVTRFELQPKLGTSVKKIAGLDGDIAMALAATTIHIEAPIPGKSAGGIEVPNKETTMVTLREVIDSDVFRKASSKLTFSLGKDIDGDVRVADIAKMPHMLIAGATGSGKSVCINSLIMSLIYKADPNDVKMILIDPKVVELQVYNGIPHLLLPVVNDPKQASATLNWCVQEMTRRYKKFAEYNVRDIRGFNEAVERGGLGGEGEGERKMPQMVIIIDELADLMMVASKEVETSICRLAQMARAAGMHLVIATQRPSVDVITGLIKANIPSRIAFAVSSGVDS
ncbi:MAG: hypothetical protein J6P72_00700, partial [Firmicutes bacterium]|nr:hypothetical protein [Bacillota bacterium]